MVNAGANRPISSALTVRMPPITRSLFRLVSTFVGWRRADVTMNTTGANTIASTPNPVMLVGCKFNKSPNTTGR